MQKTIEECRDRRGVRFIENLLLDCRFAVRMLAKSPGFTSVALLTLALGIGANTAIFSVINGVLLRPLNYRQPERLFSVREIVPLLSARFPNLPVNPNHLVQWQTQCTAFEALSESKNETFSLTGPGAPEQLPALRVSANYFQVLGTGLESGRDFLPEEDHPGRNREAVLSYSLWRERFSADPSILGRTITLDGAPYVVIGILPAWFRTPSIRQPKIFVPLAIDPGAYPQMGDFDFDAIGRLAAGITPEQAQMQLNLVQARITDSLSERLEKVELRASLTPLKSTVIKDSGQGMVLLFGAVTSILLVVCVNLAGLLIGRASQRAHETAIRSALGATRLRLVAQFLTEAALLSTCGGAAGLALAHWGLNFLLKLAPAQTPRLSEIRLDQTALAFSAAVSLICGVTLGVGPALSLSKTESGETLKSKSRSLGQDRKEARLRKVLIATEIAVSVVLVSTTGLLLTSLHRLLKVNKGFQMDRILAMDVTLPAAKYSDSHNRDRFYSASLESLEHLPGVVSAGLAYQLPLSGENWTDCASPEGDTRPFDQRPMVDYEPVNGDYFRTIGISLRAGRVFAERDRTRQVAIVSESVARLLWAGDNPIGKRMARCNPDSPAFEIIGVVSDVRAARLSAAPSLTVYVPYWYRLLPVASIAVRTASSDPLSVASGARSAIWQVDKDIPVSNVRTMEEIVSGSLAERRFQLAVLLAFASSSLLLAVLGVYGVVAESATRRTNEIGIRIALGAKQGEIVRLVLREGLAPVAAGILCGVAAALMVARSLRGLLFEVSPTDHVTLMTAVSILAIVAFIACYLPARRATRTEPVSALRCE